MEGAQVGVLVSAQGNYKVGANDLEKSILLLSQAKIWEEG
jgi:hypothetical protein